MKTAKVTTFVGTPDGQRLVWAGQVVEDDDPLAVGYPDLFESATAEPEAKPVKRARKAQS